MKILEEKQKNLLSLLFSVVGLSLILSLLSNVLFSEYYEINKQMFIVFFVFVLILIVLFLCIMIYRFDNVIYVAKLPIIYSRKDKKFIDIPYSVTSVRARVLFDNLSEKKKELIRSDGDELFEFSKSFIIQYVFSLIFDRISNISNISNWITVDRKYLKDLLVNFKYIDVDELVRKSLKLPEGFKIKAVDDVSITISTKQGFIKLSWDISMRMPCQEELCLLAQLQERDITKCMAYLLEVKLEYGYNPFKIFMKSTKDLDKYLTMCMEFLIEDDLNTIIEKAKIISLIEIIKKMEINTFKEALPVIVTSYYNK